MTTAEEREEPAKKPVYYGGKCHTQTGERNVMHYGATRFWSGDTIAQVLGETLAYCDGCGCVFRVTHKHQGDEVTGEGES